MSRHILGMGLPGSTHSMVHAHLGAMEWPQSLGHCHWQAEHLGLRLKVVKASKGGLLELIEARRQKLEGTGKPFWPSSQNRYCTSDAKRAPINKHLRTFTGIVVSCEGIRAQESANRAKKPEWQVREISTVQYKNLDPVEAVDRYLAGAGGRLALTWYPILDWTVERVWEEWGHSSAELNDRRKSLDFDGWNFHPAYVLGNDRLSCAICVLASMGDKLNGIKHNPELAGRLARMERESGFTYTTTFSIKDHL